MRRREFVKLIASGAAARPLVARVRQPNRLTLMKLPRRQFLHLAAMAAALPALSRNAKAESYPARPVHLIVMFPAGSAPDIIARLAGTPCFLLFCFFRIKPCTTFGSF